MKVEIKGASYGWPFENKHKQYTFTNLSPFWWTTVSLFLMGCALSMWAFWHPSHQRDATSKVPMSFSNTFANESMSIWAGKISYYHRFFRLQKVWWHACPFIYNQTLFIVYILYHIGPLFEGLHSVNVLIVVWPKLPKRDPLEHTSVDNGQFCL
jgi:predicted membrane protein